MLNVIGIKQAQNVAFVKGANGLGSDPVSHGYRCKSDAGETFVEYPRFLKLALPVDTVDDENEEEEQ